MKFKSYGNCDEEVLLTPFYGVIVVRERVQFRVGNRVGSVVKNNLFSHVN